jgi:aconitate hydratase
VLTITEMLRKHGVVGKFVEFYGSGVTAVPLANRADSRQHEPRVRLDLRDLPDRRRNRCLPSSLPAARRAVALVEAYAKAQGLWHDPPPKPSYSEYLELDLAPWCRASPARSARRTASR